MVVHGTLHWEKDSERFEKRAKLKVSSYAYVHCLAFLSSLSLASPMSESELVRQPSFGEVAGSWAIEKEQIGVFMQPGALPEDALRDLVVMLKDLDMDEVRKEMESMKNDASE